MRIRRKKLIIPRTIAIFALIISPVAIFGGLASWVFNGIAIQANSFAIGDNLYYNTSTFLLPNASTYQRLDSMADFYEERLHDYHLPLNVSCITTFSDLNLSIVDYYDAPGDGACWTGHTLAAEAYHYAVEKNSGNEPRRLDALEKVKRVLNGTAMLLAVPNGGIGPNYTCMLARYFCPPHLDSGPFRHVYWSLYQRESPKNANGSGRYANWRWCGHASRDQHSGLMLGLGRAWELVAGDDSWVRETIRLLVEQLVDGLQATGWSAFNGDGTPTGTHMFSTVLSSAYWCLGLLQLARAVNPEKYAGLYRHYAIERNLISQLEDSNSMNMINDYFGNNIHVAGYFNLIAMETDPQLKQLYLNKFRTRFYDAVRYHRNAWFNLAWLALSGEDNPTMEADIVDQLIRFYPNHFPNVRGPVNPRPGWHEVVPNDELVDNLLGSPVGSLLHFIVDELNLDKTVYYQPATVDMMDVASSNFIWQRCPFDPWGSSANQPRQESMSIDFLLAYWLCKYLGVLP